MKILDKISSYSASPKKINIYVDLRCLQDQAYQFRGVGNVASSLLRGCRSFFGDKIKLIGMLDSKFPSLPECFEDLADVFVYNSNVVFLDNLNIFFQPSPMTHDPIWNARFLQHQKVFSFTIIYDFIPFIHNFKYLADQNLALEYLANLKWLEFYDHYFPISDFSGSQLAHICKISPDKIGPTGCPVHSDFSNFLKNCDSNPKQSDHLYFITVGGMDSRKNVEIVIKALELLNSLEDKIFKLIIVGHYSDEEKQKIFDKYSANTNASIEFVSGISNKELASLYNSAIATLAPSFIEGFSLPVVESIMSGAPVIASNIEAHKELILQNDCLFDPYDLESLVKIMKTFASNKIYREEILNCQKERAFEFEEVKVNEAIWKKVADKFETHIQKNLSFFSTIKNKPKVAFLTPFPPDHSGVADYSLSTVKACTTYFETDVYTNAKMALANPNAAFVKGKINLTPFLSEKYDAVISVLGNSQFHTDILNFTELMGGPCILHDSRLLQIYHLRLGHEVFRQVSNKLLERSVSDDEIQSWLMDKSHPLLFLDCIVKKANPLIVHTQSLKKIILDRYGVEAIHIPFSSRLQINDVQLQPSIIGSIKKKKGFENKFVISSFGIPSQSKNAFLCLHALHEIRAQGVDAVLCMVGGAADEMLKHLLLISEELKIKEHIRLFHNPLSEDDYLDYLLLSDCFIQLREYDLGQPSGALVDCISVGMHGVATDTLAEACDAPHFVSRVSKDVTDIELARSILQIYNNFNFEQKTSEERINYCNMHSFENYAKILNETIGFC